MTFWEKYESKASEDRLSFSHTNAKYLSEPGNFPTDNPKPLKLCKMIYLGACVCVIPLISINTGPNKKLSNGHICIWCILCSRWWIKGKTKWQPAIIVKKINKNWFVQKTIDVSVDQLWISNETLIVSGSLSTAEHLSHLRLGKYSPIFTSASLNNC